MPDDPSNTPIHLVYTGTDRKPVEVLLDGQWNWGELRSWDRDEAGTWTGMVEYSHGPADTRLDRFPADHIRPTSE